MTLYQAKWCIFDVDPKPQLVDYVKEVKGMVSSGEEEAPASPTTSIDQSSLIKKRGGRLNTKLRAQTTVQEFGATTEHIDTFWERNFKSDDEVAWFKFQQAFLNDFESQLSSK